MNNRLSVISILISILCGVFPCGVYAQQPEISAWSGSEQSANTEFHQTAPMHGVEVSTDVIALALPVAALTGTLIERDWKGLVQGAYTAAATAGATLLLKYTVKERRPDFSNYHSFPSGHSAVSFATATFLQRRYGWKFGVPAYALATYVAWGRCFSRKHHWWDVVAGGAIGAGSALIFTRPWTHKHDLQIIPATDGSDFSLTCSLKF